MKTALILVDIQNDYFPNGSNPLHNAENALNNAKIILDHFRSTQYPLFFIQHFNGPDSSFFRPNTPGAEIHATIAPLPSEKVIQKNYPNSFIQTSLENDLKTDGIEHLVIVGMMSHMCIDATTRAAKDLGFSCTVIPDACATKNLTLHTGELVDATAVHNSFMAGLNGYYAQLIDTTSFSLTQ